MKSLKRSLRNIGIVKAFENLFEGMIAFQENNELYIGVH